MARESPPAVPAWTGARLCETRDRFAEYAAWHVALHYGLLGNSLLKGATSNKDLMQCSVDRFDVVTLAVFVTLAL